MEQISTVIEPTRVKPPELDELIERYGCGPVQFTGTEDALYERHLVFDTFWRRQRSALGSVLKPSHARCVMFYRNDGFEQGKPMIAMTPSVFTTFRWNS